jgi:hypothetical protein
MSRVFVAEETSLGRKVVIKLLPPELAADVSADRFRREIQLAASLRHPHIVPLLAAGRVPEAAGAGELLCAADGGVTVGDTEPVRATGTVKPTGTTGRL